MPSGSFIQVYVKCPFYQSDNGKNRIICEGITPGSQLQSFYTRHKDYKLQLEIFCCEHFEKCEIYAAIKQKYEE